MLHMQQYNHPQTTVSWICLWLLRFEIFHEEINYVKKNNYIFLKCTKKERPFQRSDTFKQTKSRKSWMQVRIMWWLKTGNKTGRWDQAK